MKKLVLVLLTSTILFSCKKKPLHEEPCPGGCNSVYDITSPNATLKADGYWHVKYVGVNYFTVEGSLSTLSSEYVINKVPLIEANFDSDYWVIFDSIQYTTPMYSYLGWFSGNQFNTPISIGSHVYTLRGLADLHSPLNIAGYQLSPHMCWDCPYTTTLIGTHSKYNYHPRQQFFLDNEMVGDTANLYIQTIFNSDVGNSEVKNTILKVIFE